MNYISIEPSINRKEVDMYYGEYFDWLCGIINSKPGIYDILIHELYSMDFFWVIELDSNRAEDGLILRGEFHDSQDELNRFENKPCSVLEALIGLSIKMNYIMDDDDRGDRTRIWFWEMIDNLGLSNFTDSEIDGGFGIGLSKINEIHDICSIWMNREFDYSGNGSPFPLNNPYEDQRKLHMIAQLNEYILEKHMFEDEIL